MAPSKIKSLRQVVILSYSDIESDPRILRQIRVLKNNFNVEITVIGCGNPIPQVNFIRVPIPSILGRYVGYLIRNHGARQWYFFDRHLDAEVRSKILNADLVVCNEIEFLPTIKNAARERALLVDLHEHHLAGVHSGLAEKIAFGRFKRWQLGHLPRIIETSVPRLVTSVSEEIADKYSAWLAGEKVHSVVNSSARLPQAAESSIPRKIHGEVRMVHHGMGRKNRGIELAVTALGLLPGHFTLHLLLRTNWIFRLRILLLARLHNVHTRVTFHNPVPFAELVAKLTEFDLSLVPGSNATEHDIYAFPNKLFESIQARLPLVVGPNPSVSRVVGSYRIGTVATDWTSRALYEAVISLEEDIRGSSMTSRLDKAANDFSPDKIDGELLELLLKILK